MLAAFGTVLFTLPHFVAPEYTYREVESYNYCRNVTSPWNVTSPGCKTTNLRDYR